MKKYDAIGFIETVGFLTMIAALDAMLKSADVLFVGSQNMDGLCTASIKGDISAVTHAINAGVKSAREVGEVVASRVITMVEHEMTEKLPILTENTVEQQMLKSKNMSER